MATVAPASDQTVNLMQNLNLEPQTKTLEVPEATKKASAYKRGSVDSKESYGTVLPSDRSATPILPEFADPNMCYLPNGYASAYYYGGYDGSLNDWSEYSRYLNADASGVYGDNGSLMYGYGYTPYGSYSPAGSPVPTMGHDGQMYGQQQYQYPSYYQSPTQQNEAYNPKQAPTKQGELTTSAASDKPALSVELTNGNSKGSVNNNINGSVPLKVSQQNSSSVLNGSNGRGGVYSGGVTASAYQDARYSYDGLKSPSPWVDSPAYNDHKHKPATSSAFYSTVSHANNIQTGRNQNQRSFANPMSLQQQRSSTGYGSSPGYYNRLYPNSTMYTPYGSNFRTSSGYGSAGYGSAGYDSRTNGWGWLSGDNKYKPKGRGNGFYGYGNENMDGLNELNRGPRAKGLKNQKVVTPSTIAVKGQDISPDTDTESKDAVNPEREQYNRDEFQVKYTDAKFFIIKSYSEDDVHKSIKYSVWASTPNGNKKLAAGYQEAQGKSGGCPVFLLFSVNTSGQFVGLAEMVGPVDFDKTVEYWQQDKWTGCFPVKWHIVKDIPNSLLKHITLENNDNKPVTNSRDTQEVRLEQGLQVIKIFKEHSCKTSILDDFEFYEGREKTVQEKKAKQQQSKQAWEGKTTEAAVPNEKENGGNNGQVKLQHSLENDSKGAKGVPVEKISILKKGSQPLENGELKPEGSQPVPVLASQANGEHKQSKETELVGKQADASEGAKPVTVTTEKTVVNGVTNGQ